eukprot:2062795-Pleurochrysis_carterae.AAC.1
MMNSRMEIICRFNADRSLLVQIAFRTRADHVGSPRPFPECAPLPGDSVHASLRRLTPKGPKGR